MIFYTFRGKLYDYLRERKTFFSQKQEGFWLCTACQAQSSFFRFLVLRSHVAKQILSRLSLSVFKEEVLALNQPAYLGLRIFLEKVLKVFFAL